jgi:hypothetical protein
MSTIMKIMLVPALVVAFAVGVAIAASGDGSSSPLAQVAPSTVDSTTSTLDTTTAETTTTEGLDISGPCDEAEHANDPRCTGVGDDRDDDNSGPGNGADDRHEDRSGHGDDDRGDDDNSGPGSHGSTAADDDDSSGPGSGDGDDDRSGHGGEEDDR